MNWYQLGIGIAETAVYSLAGIILMGIGFFLVKLFTPFSIKKEIEEEQNISLAIIIGAIILGISIIIAAVISTPATNTSVLSGAGVKTETGNVTPPPAK